MAIGGAATPVHASPWSVPRSAVRVAPPGAAEPATVEEAQEAGDLTAARQLAEQDRKDDPSAANWLREAAVLEQSGEYGAAAKAYRAAKRVASKAEDEAAVTEAEEGLQRVRDASRGTVADEPESTHRDELDQRWAPSKPPEPEPEPTPQPVDDPPNERIVTKWYFWVTVGAIAASAAAVTAIAIRAARDDQPDALDALAPAPGPRGPGVIRF